MAVRLKMWVIIYPGIKTDIDCNMESRHEYTMQDHRTRYDIRKKKLKAEGE